MSNTNVEDSKRKTCAKIHSFSYFKQKLCLPNLINSNQLNNVYPTEKFELSTAYYELYLEKEGEKKNTQTFSKMHFSFAISSGCSKLGSFSKNVQYF